MCHLQPDRIHYQPMCQAIEAFMHRQHLVALKQPNPDSCTYCSIHSCTWSADVQYGNVDIALKLYVYMYIYKN